MKKPLYIYGAGGLGREVLSMVVALNEWQPAGFIDDSMESGGEINGLSVVGDGSFLSKLTLPTAVVIALGNPHLKQMVVQRLNNPNIYFPSLVHPSVIIQNSSRINVGNGSLICAGSILTTDITIGNHVLINLKVTIGHDVIIRDWCSVMPGVNIAGEVTIGNGVLIGSGANIINKISVGDNATIGMGAVVIKNVAQNTRVVGVPAKPLGV